MGELQSGLVALRLAAGVGVVHGLFSLYWALGGRWLLDTVGSWATDLADNSPVAAGLTLLVVAVIKFAGAAVPLLVEGNRLSGRRRWRLAEWGGAAFLVLYGGVNTAIAGLVVLGVIVPDGGYDRAAMIGHAALWDPLFLLWGLFLGVGLLLTRHPGPSLTADATRPEAEPPGICR